MYCKAGRLSSVHVSSNGFHSSFAKDNVTNHDVTLSVNTDDERFTEYNSNETTQLRTYEYMLFDLPQRFGHVDAFSPFEAMDVAMRLQR